MARVEVVLKGGHAQVEDRYTAYQQDQHGRTWTGNMSRKAGDAAGQWTPTRWTSPQSPSWMRGLFVPPSQYVAMEKPEGEPTRIKIDYDRWLSELGARAGAHEGEKREIIRKMTDGYDAVKQMENPSPALLEMVGPGPFPPMIVVEEMAAGDPWALGLTDEKPSWFTDALEAQIVHTCRMTNLFQNYQLRDLAKYERAKRQHVLSAKDQKREAAGEAKKATVGEITADTKWPAFLKIMSRSGLNMKDAAEKWKEHKDSLEAAAIGA